MPDIRGQWASFVFNVLAVEPSGLEKSVSLSGAKLLLYAQKQAFHPRCRGISEGAPTLHTPSVFQRGQTSSTGARSACRAPTGHVGECVLSYRNVRNFRRSLMKLGVVAATGLLTVYVGQPAQADPLAVVAGQPLDVQANKLDVNMAAGTASLEGDVRITLGELKVACERVEIRYNEAPQVKWARATGGVTAKLQGIEAKAQTLEVDVGARRLTLVGNVRLARGKGWVEAERANINLVTQKVTLEGVRGQIPVDTPSR